MKESVIGRPGTFRLRVSGQRRDRSGGEDSPSVAALANGDFVVAWEDNAAGTNDGKFRVYHADGSPLTGELPSTHRLPGNQGRPVVAALTDGRFVVAWRDDAGGNFDIKAHIYNGDGTSAGSEFLVNNINHRGRPAGARHRGINRRRIRHQLDEFRGTDNDIAREHSTLPERRLGDEFPVPRLEADETQSTVTGLTNGNYVIAWTDGASVTGDTSGTHIEASIFSGNGTPAGPTNFLVNTGITAGDQTEPSVIGLSNGNFLVAWTTPSAGGLDITGSSIRPRELRADDGELRIRYVGRVRSRPRSRSPPPMVSSSSRGPIPAPLPG